MSFEKSEGEVPEARVEAEIEGKLMRTLGTYQDLLWRHTENSHHQHTELMDKFNQGKIDKVFLHIESSRLLDQNEIDKKQDQKLQNAYRDLINMDVEADRRLGLGSSRKIQDELMHGLPVEGMSQGTIKYILLKETYRGARELRGGQKERSGQTYEEFKENELHPWAEKNLWPLFDGFISKEDFDSVIDMY